MIKKWIASLLAAAVLLSLATTALAAAPSFPDISDPEVREDVDVLRMMGIVSGDDQGRFNPSGTLTRAQFCKMAIEAMGRGEEEALYRTRTLFPDVLSTHWARGYINMAATITVGGSAGMDGADASTGTKLIRGMSDGTFQPDRPITFAEAVTILMRTLGYDDASAGMLWPDGYLSLAGEVGLTDSLNLKANNGLTRAQAARLFCNLLDSKTKSGQRYLATLGTSKENVIVLDLDVRGTDGVSGAVRTTDGTYHMASGVVPESIKGQRGTLVLNDKDQIVTFFVDEGDQISVEVSQSQPSWILGKDGVRYNVDSDTPVYTDDEQTTYEAVRTKLTSGSQITLYLTSSGKVDTMYADLAPTSDVTITVQKAQLTWIITEDGVRYDIPANTRVYTDTDPTTYEEIRTSLTAGTQVTVYLTSAGKVESLYVSVAPSKEKNVIVSKAQATWIEGDDGIRYDIPAQAPVHTDNLDTTYDKLWVDLKAGTQVTLFQNPSGKVESLYVSLTPAEEAVIVTMSLSDHAFDKLTGGVRELRYYRNRYPAKLTDIRQYDVVTYDAEAKVIHACNQHVTGMYENAYPNPESPLTITVMGATFPVMRQAMDSLASFKIGQEITVLLTQDGQVAGVVSPQELRVTMIGLVDEISSSSVKVTLLNGVQLESKPNPDQDNLDISDLKGQLVSVSCRKLGTLNLNKVATGPNPKLTLNLKNMTLGDYRVNDSVALYERVGASALVPITLDDLTMSKIPANKIAYSHRDVNDNVDILVFRDVTGDQYAYGFFEFDDGEVDDYTPEYPDIGDIGDIGDFMPEEPPQATVGIRNSGKYNTVSTLNTDQKFRDGGAGGLVAARDGTVAASVTLKQLKEVSRYDFTTRDNMVYVTVNGVEYPVSKNVECYNKAADLWFDSLMEARAFSDNLTLYYDRAPEEGGKIRLVVAN